MAIDPRNSCIHFLTKVIRLPLNPVPLRLLLVMRQLDVVHLLEGVVAGAHVVALVGQVRHGGHQFPVEGEDGADAVR